MKKIMKKGKKLIDLPRGRWVRYKVMYKGEPIYANRDGKWSYQYLASFYPEGVFDKSTWMNHFTAYLSQNGTYDCVVQEVLKKRS